MIIFIYHKKLEFTKTLHVLYYYMALYTTTSRRMPWLRLRRNHESENVARLRKIRRETRAAKEQYKEEQLRTGKVIRFVEY